MKKKILASLLLSTVLVSQAAVLTTVHAETTDEKIAAQDSKISNLTAQQKEAQKQVDEIQTQVTAIQTQQTNLQVENESPQKIIILKFIYQFNLEQFDVIALHHLERFHNCLFLDLWQLD